MPKIVRFILEDTPDFRRVILNEYVDGSDTVENTLNAVYQHNVARANALEEMDPVKAQKMLDESHAALPENLRP
ncbi:hypothetical protein HY031_02340 [Candidatus Gottesmanbacteria bacterium]|nr:hypothetical protein [Candidatus Gottesmanbacteria bacterium]